MTNMAHVHSRTSLHTGSGIRTKYIYIVCVCDYVCVCHDDVFVIININTNNQIILDISKLIYM